MKTIKRLTGTENELTNFAAAIGLMVVTTLIASFAIMAINNGIKPF